MKFNSSIITGSVAAGAGGATGAALRAVLTGSLDLGDAGFMFMLFAVNLLGCFLFGFFQRMVLRRRNMGQRTRDFLLTGFCGGLTTFSTIMSLTELKSLGCYWLFVYFAVMSYFGMYVLSLGDRAASKIVKIG